MIDAGTGEVRQAQLFVATLGASNLTYAEASWSQSLSDWVGAHCRAFAYFGGVPAQVACDNLKSGVTKACFYEPAVNRTYADMATHYGTAVVPNTATLVEVILRDRSHPEQGFRSCLGIMRLAKPYGPEALEAACERALTIGARSYSSVNSILKSEPLERHWSERQWRTLHRKRPEPAAPSRACESMHCQARDGPAIQHGNIRGSGYFQ